MSDFSPGLHRAPKGKASRADYPPGSAGIRASIDKVCEKAVEARFDPDVQGWGKAVLKKRGLDGRDGAKASQIMAGILEEIRDVTVYVSDAYGAEVIQSAAATLCLRPGLCIAGGDCDDLVVVLAGVLLALGIRVWIVKQSWRQQDQEHVLVAGEDEHGEKFFLDPSTRLSAGSKYPADEMVFYDPMERCEAKPELVTLGQPHAGLGALPPSSAYGKALTDLATMQTTLGAGDTYLAASEWQSAVSAYQAAGNVGATIVGPDIDLAGAPNTTQPLTQKAWTQNAALAAVSASSSASQADAQLAQGYAKAMVSLYQQAIAAGSAALQNHTDAPSAGPQTSTAAVVGAAVGLGVIAGVLYAVVRQSRQRAMLRLPERPVRRLPRAA